MDAATCTRCRAPKDRPGLLSTTPCCTAYVVGLSGVGFAEGRQWQEREKRMGDEGTRDVGRMWLMQEEGQGHKSSPTSCWMLTRCRRCYLICLCFSCTCLAPAPALADWAGRRGGHGLPKHARRFASATVEFQARVRSTDDVQTWTFTVNSISLLAYILTYVSRKRHTNQLSPPFP